VTRTSRSGHLQNDKLVIAMTGPFGSGATTVAAWLAKHKRFLHFRVHTIIKEYIERNGENLRSKPLSEQRALMQKAGDDLRRTHGLDYLVRESLKRAWKKVGRRPGLVIDSLKNPYEVEALRKQPNSFVLAIYADKDERWRRVAEKYSRDQKQFDDDDARDRGESEKFGQDVSRCVDLADVSLANSDPCDSDREWKERLWQPVERFMALARVPGSFLPTQEEVFMNEAYCKSLSSQCLNRQVGAVVAIGLKTRDGPAVETAISSAYNAVPRGQKECTEEFSGHCFRDRLTQRNLDGVSYCPNCGEVLKSDHSTCSSCGQKVAKILPGKNLEFCRAAHAEESAILKVANLGGLSLFNATLYSTTFPCQLCAKQIISAGISRVVWVEAYPHGESHKMLGDAGVELVQFSGVKARGFYRLFRRPLSSA